jgi:hypothetical protein
MFTGTCGQDPMSPPPFFFNIDFFFHRKKRGATYGPVHTNLCFMLYPMYKYKRNDKIKIIKKGPLIDNKIV